MINNIHENITQFWLAEKGVQFFCNTSKKLVIRVQIANMVSDWLKTQKKPPRTNQIRAVFTTNKLLITEYAKVKKIKNNGCNNTQTSHFQQFEWTRIQVFHDIQQGFQVTYVVCWRRKVSGCSLWVFSGAKTSIKTSMRWSVVFYLSSKRNQKSNIWSKLNQRAKIP